MKRVYLFMMCVAMMISCAPKKQSLNYPMINKVYAVDVYFGTDVADPYRVLENCHNCVKHRLQK